jgi:hypothetical protein
MRDTVAVEDRGIPTVTVTVDDLLDMSTAQATVLGHPDLAVVPLRLSLYGRDRDEIAAMVEPFCGAIEAGLTRAG